MSSTEKDDKNENESIPKLLWAINVTANNYQIRWISIAIRAVRVKQHIDISRIAFTTEDMQLFCFVSFWFGFVWFSVCVFVCEYRSDVCTCQFNWNSISNESFNSIGWQDQLLIWHMKTIASIIWHAWQSKWMNEMNLHGTWHGMTCHIAN